MKSTLQLTALTALLVSAPGTVTAQAGATVEILAGVLAAEDARHYDEGVLRRALADPDSTVRRYATLSAGRIGDPAALDLLAPLLTDLDSTVQANAIFAMGLLGDTAAVPLLTRRARDGAWLSSAAAFELVTAAARIGGGQGATLVRDILRRTTLGDRADSPYLAAQAAEESWRLGSLAPVEDLLGMAQDSKVEVRLGAVYSLGRLRLAAGVPRLLDALSDRESPLVRAAAARGLGFQVVSSSSAAPTAVAERLRRAAGDVDPGVRINALRALVTYPAIPQGEKLIPLLDDVHSNVQVQAAQALARASGVEVTAALVRVAESEKGSWARRREALLALARQDSAAFFRLAGAWATHADWRRRTVAAEGFGRIRPSAAAALTGDREPRVVAEALGAWRADSSDGPALLDAARRHLTAADAAVRSVAAGVVGAAGTEADIGRLVDAARQARRDSFPDAIDSALAAIVRIAERSPNSVALERGALALLPMPDDYRTRAWAENYWPEAAAAWGPAYPLDPGSTLQDYREVVERFLTGPIDDRYPHVIVEIEGLGRVEVKLFGPDAPLTVATYLRLVDRRYFDGQRFHRVVPNFLAQAGDPRGDGYGGTGIVIRDEINRRRFEAYMMGMALSGPNSGGSQWFITLSPQPHLDGTYTLFGEVVDGYPTLQRVTQGDQIRSIHRP